MPRWRLRRLRRLEPSPPRASTAAGAGAEAQQRRLGRRSARATSRARISRWPLAIPDATARAQRVAVAGSRRSSGTMRRPPTRTPMPPRCRRCRRCCRRCCSCRRWVNASPSASPGTASHGPEPARDAAPLPTASRTRPCRRAPGILRPEGRSRASSARARQTADLTVSPHAPLVCCRGPTATALRARDVRDEDRRVLRPVRIGCGQAVARVVALCGGLRRWPSRGCCCDRR